MPGQVHNLVKNIPCLQGINDLTVGRINQVKFLVSLYSLHKGIGDGYGKIKIGESGLVLLGRNKFHNIRVIYTQNSHVGSTSFPTLLNSLSSGIKNSCKTKRPGCNPLGGLHC